MKKIFLLFFSVSWLIAAANAQVCANDTVTVTEPICSYDFPYVWHGNIINAGGAGVDTLFLQNTGGCDSLIILNLVVDAPVWTNYTHTNSGLISDAAVQGICIDAQNNKWITNGGSNGGVSMFDGTNWVTYNQSNGMPNNNAYGIAVDNLGDIWVGTSGYISRFNGTTWTNYSSAAIGFSLGSEVRAITVDAANNLWIATQANLAFFNGTTWTSYDPSNSGMPNYGSINVAIDASGNKWISTQTAGATMFDGTNWNTYTTSNSGLVNNNVWAVGIDASNNKWFGTWGGGVSKFDGTNWTTYTTSNSGLVSNNVRNIHVDAQGNIWFGTGSGVGMFDGTNWHAYTTISSQLIVNHTFDMAEDTSGNIWIGGFDTLYMGGVSVISAPCLTVPPCTPTTGTDVKTACGSYTWIDGNTYTINNMTAMHTLVDANANGCDSIVTLNLTIMPQPDLSVSATMNGCSSINLDTISIADANATGAVLAWFTDSACTVPVTVPGNVTVSGIYYAVGTAASCSDTVALNITISPVLNTAVVVAADQPVICENATVTYTANVSAGGSSPVYQWYKNGTPVGTNAATYSDNTLTATDQVYVRITVADACAAAPVIESNHVTVSVSEAFVPDVNITVAPGTVFIAGQPVTFTAHITNSAGPNPSFVWLKNGAPAAGAPSTGLYTTTSLQNGDVISCILYSDALCALPDTAVSNSITMTQTTGIGENSMQASVTVFPNPALETVHILVDADVEYPGTWFRIVDISGKAVVSMQQPVTAGNQQLSIDVSSLPAGIYQLQITVKEAVVMSKSLVIAK